GRSAIRDLRGRWIDDVDLRRVDAERARGDLREDRDRALADVGRARPHLVATIHGARDGRAAGEPLLARAGEAGAVVVEHVAAAAAYGRAVADAVLARRRTGHVLDRGDDFIRADREAEHLAG